MADRGIVDTWELLVRFHRSATRAMDEHLRERFGYSLDNYDVLHRLHVDGNPMRMGDLAEQLLVANSSCNRIVGQLVDAGFVERNRDAGDGRIVLVSLTSKGRTLRQRMAAVHVRDIEARMGGALSANQLSELDRILRRLIPE